jgi:hypothetical protein
MLLREEIMHINAGSCWLWASSGLLCPNSSFLLIAYVKPLRNSRSNPEKKLCEDRFQLIVILDFVDVGGLNMVALTLSVLLYAGPFK